MSPMILLGKTLYHQCGFSSALRRIVLENGVLFLRGLIFSIRSILPNLNRSFNTTILLFGIFGTLLASFALLSYLSLFLEVTCIAITSMSMGTAIMRRSLIKRMFGIPISSKGFRARFIAWFIGIATVFFEYKWTYHHGSFCHQHLYNRFSLLIFNSIW